MNNGHRPDDLIRTTEARKLLGVSTVKMTQLIKHGILPSTKTCLTVA